MKARSAGSPRMPEKVFVVLALLLFTGAFLALLGGGDEATSGAGDGNFLAQASYLSIYGITFLLIVVRFRRFVYVATREPLLVLLVVLAMLSVLWSVAPDITFRRSVALLGTTLFGGYLAMRFSLREQLQLLAWTLGIAALLSLVFALALPVYGVESGARGDALRGIYNQKNVLGRLMALSAVVFLFLALGDRRYRLFKWGGFGLSLGLLWLSDAKTALVILLVILVLLPFGRALREAYTIAAPILIVGILACASALIWFSSNTGTTLAALDRDVTLTGRTDLWAIVLEMIAERPWLGYGYNAFWLGWEGESAQVWLALSPYTISFYPTHAHNGMLDLWLDLGFLGVLLFVLVFLLAFGRAVRLIRSTEVREGIWPLAYLTFMLLSGLTYPIGLERNSIWWVLFVATVVSLAARASRIRKQRPPAPDRVYGEKKLTSVG
ncbi:MAG: O-antigen ligase family protein [Rubrobacter sp.]